MLDYLSQWPTTQSEIKAKKTWKNRNENSAPVHVL